MCRSAQADNQEDCRAHGYRKAEQWSRVNANRQIRAAPTPSNPTAVPKDEIARDESVPLRINAGPNSSNAPAPKAKVPEMNSTSEKLLAATKPTSDVPIAAAAAKVRPTSASTLTKMIKARPGQG